MRPRLIFACVAFVLAILIVRQTNQAPTYTDAYYHYNAAVRVAQGDGFVDDYLWTYIGAPETLPAPSHMYWMPGTTIIASIGMALFGVSFASAQIGLIACLWGTALIAYEVGFSLRGVTRQAWVAGLLTLFCGFFMRYWGTTDTFAPYAFFGALALLIIGRAAQQRSAWRWALAGVCAAAGHLVRSDGLLLVLVGVGVIVLMRQTLLVMRGRWMVVFMLGYMLAMSPWFVRNLVEVGTVLPVGGTQAIWYTGYDDLFAYPPQATPQTFFADGVEVLLTSRWEALIANLQTLLAVEGVIVLLPFMLWALWQRRPQPFWWGISLFALGIHAAFTLLFPFPGVRGGLFHAAAALVPFWMSLGIDGVDSAIDWMARRRHNWRPATAKPFFSGAAVLLVGGLGISISGTQPQPLSLAPPPLYLELQSIILPDERVMRNDPAQLYYYTGLGGVVLPNAPMTTVVTLIQRYAIDYVMLEYPNVPAPLDGAAIPTTWRRVPFTVEGVELYDVRP